jgi:hypothetical protein
VKNPPGQRGSASQAGFAFDPGQLDEFAPKYIVHAQLSRDFTGDISRCARRINVHFLKKQKSASAWPRNSKMAGSCKPRSIFSPQRERSCASPKPPNGAKFSARFPALARIKNPCSKLWKDALLGETQVQWIIDLTQGNSLSASPPNPFVSEFLYGDVKNTLTCPGNEMFRFKANLPNMA